MLLLPWRFQCPHGFISCPIAALTRWRLAWRSPACEVLCLWIICAPTGGVFTEGHFCPLCRCVHRGSQAHSLRHLRGAAQGLLGHRPDGARRARRAGRGQGAPRDHRQRRRGQRHAGWWPAKSPAWGLFQAPSVWPCRQLPRAGGQRGGGEGVGSGLQASVSCLCLRDVSCVICGAGGSKAWLAFFSARGSLNQDELTS